MIVNSDKSRLDDSLELAKLDPNNMRDRLYHFPDQCMDAWNQGVNLSLIHI